MMPMIFIRAAFRLAFGLTARLSRSVSRVWAARVYPAGAWGSNVKFSINTCTGLGFTNTGLIPYGGVIQIDPKLDLTQLTLTLPASLILEAIQTYG